jgi:outer membrane murein-binding lipoprotein Lpp
MVDDFRGTVGFRAALLPGTLSLLRNFMHSSSCSPQARTLLRTFLEARCQPDSLLPPADARRVAPVVLLDTLDVSETESRNLHTLLVKLHKMKSDTASLPGQEDEANTQLEAYGRFCLSEVLCVLDVELRALVPFSNDKEPFATRQYDIREAVHDGMERHITFSRIISGSAYANLHVETLSATLSLDPELFKKVFDQEAIAELFSCRAFGKLGPLLERIEQHGSGMDEQVAKIITALDALDAKVEEALDPEVKALDAKVGGLDAKVEALDAKVGELDAKVVALDGKVGELDSKVDKLDAKLDQHSQQMMAALHAAVATIMHGFDAKQPADENAMME